MRCPLPDIACTAPAWSRKHLLLLFAQQRSLLGLHAALSVVLEDEVCSVMDMVDAWGVTNSPWVLGISGFVLRR